MFPARGNFSLPRKLSVPRRVQGAVVDAVIRSTVILAVPVLLLTKMSVWPGHITTASLTYRNNSPVVLA